MGKLKADQQANWQAAYVPMQTTYHGVPEDVGAARRLIAERIPEAVPRETIELAVLLTSELVTNAVLHTRSALILHLDVRPDAIRIAVEDDCMAPPRLQPPTATSEHGRGLRLLIALASRWGCQPTAIGKSIWFELDC